MEIRNNILATLSYYDIFDFPLKAEEVLIYLINFKHLNIADDGSLIKLEDIKKNLDQLILDNVIGLRDGYYFLFNREYIVPLRLKRQTLAKRKWKIIKRTVRWLSLLPYMRLIFAFGSLAMNNTNELSDLDVLIVVKHGRIWLSRFLILGMLAVLGVRRKGSDLVAPDKICPGHFITDQSLNLSFGSLYNAMNYVNLIPVYVRDDYIIDRFNNENKWILDYLYHPNIKNKSILNPGWTRVFSKVAEIILDTRIGSWFEKLTRNYQMNRIEKNPLTKKAGGRIIINDKQIIFRINSKIFESRPTSLEEQSINNYHQRLSRLGLSNLAIEKISDLT